MAEVQGRGGGVSDDEPKALYFYAACIVCGNNDFISFVSDARHKGVPEGTPCIVCPKCGRFGSTANWDAVNGGGRPRGAA